MALTLADRGEKLHSETLFLNFFPIFTIPTLCNYESRMHLQEIFLNISA